MYRHNNFSYVIDSSFQPFSMQEMLTPFVMYKDAFEKSEAAYDDLRSKADRFKYLSESLPEGSRARQIYEGYANDLNAQAQDFANNGLGISNRRALTGLRQRYQGEIGRLYEAETALKKEQDLRRQLNAKDPSMLYGTDNLDIDMFLDNNTPNLYSISGNELYTRGAQLGRSISSRIYNEGEDGSVLGGLYKNWKTTQGVSNADIGNFLMQPAVQEAIQNDLKARGVTDNLTGNNLDRATRSYMQGIYEGIVYQEKSNPMRDPRVLTPTELADERRKQSQEARAQATFNMQTQDWIDKRNLTYEFDSKGNVIGYKDQGVPTGYERDPLTGKLYKTATSGKSSGSGSSGSGGEKKTISKEKIRLVWDGNDPEKDEELARHPKTAIISDDDVDRGEPMKFDELPDYVKQIVMKRIGSGKAGYYDYYFTPYKSGSLWGLGNDTEAQLEMIPRDLKKDDSSISLDDLDNDSDLE